MKIVLFVEGYTEVKVLPDFLTRWLNPRLTQPIKIKPVRFDGWRDYVDGIAKKVEVNLSGKAGTDVVAAIGLLDLYGPTFYPAHLASADARYTWAKQDLEKKVGHPRFRQHFAVHETEAWLLSQPALLPTAIGAALPGRCAQPETVNSNAPPAKLLGSLYWEKQRTAYKKVTDGADLFKKLDPQIAYNKCPYLKALLDDMLALARAGIP